MTNECSRCGHALDESGICQACGQPARRELGLVRGYFETVWQILTRPTRFFRVLPLSGGIGGPLAFALVTHWIGSALEYLWRSLLGGRMGDVVGAFLRMAGDVADIDHPGRGAQLFQMKERMSDWFWGVGPVVADPFLTLVSILFTSILVFMGARIFVAPGRDGAPAQITYESAVRIVCFGMTPALLAGLPIFGTLLSTVLILVVTVIAARECYRITTGRAIVVALFPKLLFLGLFLLGIFFLFVVALKFLTMAF